MSKETEDLLSNPSTARTRHFALLLKVNICFVSDPVWPHVTNGQIPNGFPTSQSLNFAAPKVPWNSEAMSNPFAV